MGGRWSPSRVGWLEVIVRDGEDHVIGSARRAGGKILLVALLGIISLGAGDQPSLSWSSDSPANKPSEIRAILRRAADWQLAHPELKPRDWTNAVFYMGLMAAHRATGEPRYLAELIKVGEENLWQPGRRYRHADDHAIAQTYLDLFQISKEKSRKWSPPERRRRLLWGEEKLCGRQALREKRWRLFLCHG